VTASYDPRSGRYAGGRAFGLPEPRLPVPSAAELERLVRFEHPAKFLAVKELPGAALMSDGCLAAAYGCSASALVRVRAALAAELEGTADALLADREVRAAVEAFPVRRGGTFVALGDSITDDLQSWAELLRRCLERLRPGEVTVVNAGVSGDTTVDALGRLYGIAELEPDLVVAMLGTNDCQRHGPQRAQLVPPGASCDNAAAISCWLGRAGARVVWLTPPPVDSAALAATVGARPFAIDADDVRRLSAGLRSSGLEVVDTGSRLDPSTAAGHLLPDGVHPSLAGQRRIAESVLRALAKDPAHASG
jgi:lysophospholipase L1-like esterase